MESLLYDRLVRATPNFHWQRHEDKLAKGIPDCSYGSHQTGGWIELKTYDNWPKEEASPLKWSDLKAEQVNWLIARGRKCGHCYILLEVGKDPKTSDWLLISWHHLRKIKQYNRKKLMRIACFKGVGPISKDIVSVLTQHDTPCGVG